MHMRFPVAWAEWNVLRTILLPLFILQVFVLGFFGIGDAVHLLLSREPATLELRTGHSVATAQELLVFLQQFPPVSRVMYRTREQQFLASQAMFPNASHSERSVALFHDALLVHVRTEQGYWSLLGVLVAEPRWQGLITPSALVRMGEQAQKMHSGAALFRILRLVALGVIFVLSCGIFLSLLHRARQAFGFEEENGVLQDFLGATSLSIAGPVAGRLTVVVTLGVLLSLVMIPIATMLLQRQSTLFVTILLQILRRTWWQVLLAEGTIAAFLSVGGVILCRYASCAPLRLAHSADN